MTNKVNISRVSIARSYYGAFERIGTAWRYHTPAGHYDYSDRTHYFYARDYLGSTRAVYAAASSGYRTTQQVRYFPSGVPVELSTATPTTDRLHHGKQWINRNGFGHYFNSARLHDALTARFDNPGPLASSNPGVSPYAHCNGDNCDILFSPIIKYTEINNKTDFENRPK